MSKRIALWSSPRNLSTALMYAFAQRTDTEVWDEPLYAHYLARSKSTQFHPAADEVMKAYDRNGRRVITKMLEAKRSEVYFFKNMTHHLLKLDLDFMKDLYNVVLTRDPKEMLSSFTKVIKNPTMEEVGYLQHLHLVQYYQLNDIPYIILDSTEISNNPRIELKKICDFVGIDFDRQMLTWEKGGRPEDGPWAPYWYKSLHESTGFEALKPKSISIEPNLEDLYKECMECYSTLMQIKKFNNQQ